MSALDPFEGAREQAAEYLGFMASERIVTKDGVFEIPYPSLLDDEQQTRYDQLQFDAEGWDRHDDGSLKEPHRKDGVLVENYNIQLAKAIMGDRYAAFKAAGGRANDVSVIWWKMRKGVADRQAADSKSGAGTGAVDAVPDPD
jgi:hypothetical protein